MRSKFYQIIESPKKAMSVIFLVAFCARFLLGILTKFDHYSLGDNTHRYDILSKQILSGNWDFDIVAYIISPGYPLFISIFRYYLGVDLGFEVAMWLQVITICISAIYLYKLSLMLFKDKKVAFITGICYAFYPMTLYHNWQSAQESLFQPFMIFFLYQYAKLWLNECKSLKQALIVGIWLTLTFQVKSHILVATPIMFLIHLLHYKRFGIRAIQSIIVIGASSFILSLPWTIYNYQKHDVFVVSSYGTPTLFRFGNNWSHYYNVVDESKIEIENTTILFDKEFNDPKYGFINQLPIKERTAMQGKAAFDWIYQNPIKFLRIKWHGFYSYFMPGVSYGHHANWIWLISFIASLPFFLFGFIGLLKTFIKEKERHIWVYPFFLCMLLFYIIFVPLSRFRSVTIEPILIMYACYQISYYYSGWRIKN